VRHIPEEELHAYLDQALSRSQCVEIERHLARCARCRLDRDSIAALRDRTTELLARLSPPSIIPPAFSVLQSRRAERLRRRRQWVIAGGWAASIAGALLLGWDVNSRYHIPSPRRFTEITVAPATFSPVAPTSTPRPVASKAPPASARAAEAASPGPRQLHAATSRGEPAVLVRYAQAVETDPPAAVNHAAADSRPLALAEADPPEITAAPVGADPALQGIWRTILPDSSTGAQGAGDAPRVPGLPVVTLRVQPGDGGTEVTAVDQLLASGEVIRTIAGPALRVGSLVAREATAQNPTPAQTGDTRMTVTIRQGDQMVAVTGPSQALGSLLSRVNFKRRRY